MDIVKELLSNKTPARLAMIAAILLLFVSQFFLYINDPGGGVLTNATNMDYYTELVITSFTQIGTGWELHPHAYVILVILGFAFLRDDIADSPLFSRFGWWVALILVLAATAPGAYFRNAPGAMMGGIAAMVAFGAVILHVAEVKRATRPAAASAEGQGSNTRKR